MGCAVLSGKRTGTIESAPPIVWSVFETQTEYHASQMEGNSATTIPAHARGEVARHCTSNSKLSSEDYPPDDIYLTWNDHLDKL